jgi:ABC-type transport system involved in multi-copper enzyme maturation permease subunit
VIWLTWRQHRSEALVLGCIMLAAAAVLVVLELDMSHAIDQLGLARCTDMTTGPCGQAAGTFLREFAILSPTVFLTLVPGVVGMFVGAPMVARELDRRTHWLVWSQDVSRGRWLLVKSAGVLLLGAAGVGVFTLALTWTLGTFFRVAEPAQWASRLWPFFFDVEGVVPVAATVFALSLGTAAGAVLRRTLPAMLVVLIVFAAVRVGVAQARFFYPPAPLTTTMPLSVGLPQDPGGGWRVGGWEVVDGQGNPVTGRNDPCLKGSGDQLPACAGYRFLIHYQPADRFWPFQAIESGIYLVLSVLLLALTAYWVRRRIT